MTTVIKLRQRFVYIPLVLLLLAVMTKIPDASAVMLNNLAMHIVAQKFLKNEPEYSMSGGILLPLGSNYEQNEAHDWLSFPSRLLYYSIGLDAKRGYVHRNYGRINLLQGEPTQAKYELELANKIDPQDVITMMELGDVFARKGNHRVAFDFWAQGSNSRVAGERLRSLAREYIFLGDTETGIRLLWRVVEKVPDTDVAAYAYINLANLAKEDGQYKMAKELYLQSLNILPYYPEALGNMGWVLGRLGEHSDAINYLHRAIVNEPNNPWWWQMLTSQYAILGMCEEAVEAGHSAEQAFETMKSSSNVLTSIAIWSSGLCKSDDNP